MTLLLIGATTACEEALEEDPKGSLAPEFFFRTEEDLHLAITPVYGGMLEAFNSWGGIAPMFGGDDLTTLAGSNKQGFKEFDVFEATNTNDRMGAMWGNAYGSIKNANNFLLNYEKADVSDEIKQQYAGQAHFLRALAYFYLVRIWGEIPLVEGIEPDFEQPKAEVADVYALIESDLLTAEAFLPDTWEAFEQGVVPTKGTAKALLSSVYLTMAGWPLQDASKYALAAAQAGEVIDAAGTYGYELMPEFADLWDGTSKSDAELVFGIFYENQYAWPNVNMMGPRAGQPGAENGWDDYFSEIHFFNDFPEGPRKEATFLTEIAVEKNEDGTLTKMNWQEVGTRHPYFKKYRFGKDLDPENPFDANWMSDRTAVLMRYAHVLLIYAEAQAMANRVDASAYEALNQVRRRAGLEEVPLGLSREDFRDAVIQERAWEFAAEPEGRWFDLIRTERVEEATADRGPAEVALPNPPTKADYWAPIPNGDVLINPALGGP